MHGHWRHCHDNANAGSGRFLMVWHEHKTPILDFGPFFAIFGPFLAHFGPEVKLARCEIPNTSTSLVVGNLGLQLHATAVGIGTKKTAGTCISTQERPLCLKKPMPMAYRHRSWSPHPQPKAEFAHFFRAPLSLQRHRRPFDLPCAVWAPHRASNGDRGTWGRCNRKPTHDASPCGA